MFETFSLKDINTMGSAEYAEHFNGPNGNEFRARIDFLESQPKAPRSNGNEATAQAAAPAPGFDPSFDADPNISAAKAHLEASAKAAAPAATEQPAAPAAEPMPREKMSVWAYQPTDSQGRKIGGEQVFRYDPNLPVDDPKSLASQLTKAHKSATIALRSKKLEQTVASISVSETPFEEPRRLSTTEHPDAERLNELSDQALGNAVSSALALFQTRHPEYQPNNESAAALIQMVQKSRKNPADYKTWDECWATLKPLLEVPVATASPAAAPVAETKVAAAAPAPAAEPASAIPFVLSNTDSFNPAVPAAVRPAVTGAKIIVEGGKVQIMDLKTWDQQSSDFQKRALRNPANARAIDLLYDQAQAARAARRAQGGR